MVELDIIKKPIAQNLAEYDAFVRRSLGCDDAFVAGLMDYIISSGGKGIRPMLVVLSAALHARNGVGMRTYLAAMIIEMIHNASLVHDDLIDGAATRHGKPAVHVRWNNHISVLAGDYILARAFSTGMQSAQFDIVSYITSAIVEIVEGELIQSDHKMSLVDMRKSYFDVIFKKTAVLLGTCSGVGALSVGATSPQVGIARQIGINLGIAFQIRDDILDFAPESQTGKSSCSDLREGKITLPLISVLERCDDAERQHVMELLAAAASDPQAARQIADFVCRNGGLDEAARTVDDYLQRARSIIETYPDSEYRHSLLLLCEYIGTRDH